MCGIAGFIDFSNSSTLQILQECTDTLEHRGPDGGGYEFMQQDGHQVGLGHRRLSIIDLSNAASQPMWYKDYCIIFNGEIYNYQEIKDTLAAKGHTFTTHSDTEMILHAYEEWGSKALDQFIGMFAFAIFDRRTNKLFACRDRAGVKPFFYYQKNGLFMFASELKAIIKHPAFVKSINIDAAAAYMQFGYVPTPHCIFEDTAKLKPGHFLEFDLTKKEVRTQQYWNLYDAYNKPELKIGLPEAITETEKLLTNAFQYRMVSDVPVGVFLSGGYDSSCVTALLQANNTEKIKTFTIGVPDVGLNEAPYAKDIAARLGTDHTEYYCTQKEALEIVPQLPHYYDEPFADSSAIPTTLVSRIAREKVTVALSADAGDEIFAGYNRYDYMMKYGKRLQSIPKFIRKSAAATMELIPANSIPVLNKKYLFHTRYEKMKMLLKNPSEENMLMSLTTQISADEIGFLFKNKITVLSTAFDSKELNEERYSPLAYNMAIDYQTYLLDDILQKVDRATMSVSLEGREPFLDQRIIEWAAQLPMKYKYNNGNKKFIIKEIVHKYLPKEIMERPKMGFGIPIASWLQKDLKPFVDEYFDETFIEKQNIFNNREVQKIRRSFYQGKVERAEKLWYLLMFQMWYDKWMNGN
ncbi:asparagine synthase (glutamine-hydrolyzing) [Ferruginibacter sp. HRS2-29]|uniref:asparagine synthase (glutamine-hydrolyzing) n=1 Tax=Ferruginibacter sp. HRS2-29 TaxID=2487334 RepID=UPI0020CC3B96|nr:asparagine synthase (glutamine-hydrolyzing) [Ferruginibacter sp. HRS2-29]MCP9749925.1 asparagine synthase (glutamine-hydrolyzing) [Ferruginibacter sp. HRS2-29]